MNPFMPYRFPDDPRRVSKEYVAGLDAKPQGTFLAQMKSDGWRRVAYRRNGEWTYYAKHDKGEQSRKTPPPALVGEFEALGWPDNVAIDMEWMGPRLADVLDGRHSFRLFDLHYLNGRWLGDVGFKARFDELQAIFDKAGASPSVQLVRPVGSNLFQFMKAQESDPTSEGIVIRRASSGLIGDFRDVKDNPSWFKAKHRDIHEATVF